MKIDFNIFPTIIILIVIAFAGLSMFYTEPVAPIEQIIPLPEYYEYTIVPNFTNCDSTRNRVENFVNFMIPLIEYENQSILQDRTKLKELTDKNLLSSQDTIWITEKAKYYKYTNFTFSTIDFDELAHRIDMIPQEIILAQAAIESNWGSSAFATKYNNLFGTRTSSKSYGVVPKKRATGATFRVAKYRSVNQSIRSYLRNINSHSAYSNFRNQRFAMRNQEQIFDPFELSNHLTAYSTLGNDYVRIIQRTMREYSTTFSTNNIK